MNDDEYGSVADRQKASQARVHTELTSTARERIVYISANPLGFATPTPENFGSITDALIESAVSRTYEDVGTSAINDKMNIEMSSPIGIHRNIHNSCNTTVVLAYVENLVEIVYNTNSLQWDISIPTLIDNQRFESETSVIRYYTVECVERINKVMETEGILWEMDVKNEAFDFRPIGSELMAESDERFNSVAIGKRWMSVASPYDTAYSLYRDRTYSREIPEKLYNSIEELCRVICVDLQEWKESRQLNLGEYTQEMRNKGLFDPNPIMRAEIEDLSRSMEKAFQKAGDERHNRHHEIDREYCTLMLHQVSAYITYIIRQYEKQYIEDT